MEKQEYRIMYDIENDFWWYRGLHELVYGAIKKIFGEKKDVSILDAGCGTGRMLEVLGEYENKEGFDYSADAVDFCGQRGLKNVTKEDLSVWMPPVEKYDCLISLDVLCNLDDDFAAMEKFQKALKPGGVLIMNLPAFQVLRRTHDLAVWSKRRYRLGKVKADLKKIGFEVSTISYRLPWLFFIALAVKIKDKILKPKNAQSDLKKMPKIFNDLLLFANRFNNKMILLGVRCLLGSSLFVISRKK